MCRGSVRGEKVRLVGSWFVGIKLYLLDMLWEPKCQGVGLKVTRKGGTTKTGDGTKGGSLVFVETGQDENFYYDLKVKETGQDENFHYDLKVKEVRDRIRIFTT